MQALSFTALDEAVQREVEEGLTACQVAVGHRGEVIWTKSLGRAHPGTRFWAASATKPIVASALWHFIADGQLEVERPVAHYIPEFAANGKQDVTVEQVFLMTCGFPDAPIEPEVGGDAGRRIAQLADWELQWEPGSRYAYHGISAHYVLAELIERLSGEDFRDFVEARVTRPLGLPRILGIPRRDQTDVIQLEDADYLESLPFEMAAKIEAGEPGGGAVMRASDLALFYQGLLHNPGELWDPAVLADAVDQVRCTLPDPLMNLPANRTLGVVVGAGFGTTWGESPTAYGWPGMGGQVGFAEPATGISFAFLQHGDRDEVSQFVRGIRMSQLALQLAR